jgi:hypothetical protein
MRKTRSSQAFLKEYRSMQEAKAHARSLSAEYAGSASVYRHLCHMSEANGIAEDLGLRVRYRPHDRERKGGRSNENEVVCHVYENDQYKAEISLVAFERRFKALQGRWNLLKISDKADPNAKRELAVTAPVTVSEKTPAATVKRSATRLLSRDEQENLQKQIKRVTLETLALADRMHQQLDVLEKETQRRPTTPFIIH